MLRKLGWIFLPLFVVIVEIGCGKSKLLDKITRKPKDRGLNGR